MLAKPSLPKPILLTGDPMIEMEDKEEKTGGKEPAIKNVELKKNVQYKKALKVGDIAHYHRKEDDEKVWEEACPIVAYTILDPKGFRINDDRYVGRVIVSQCMADQLAYMDAARAIYEKGVFQGKQKTRMVGSF